MFILLSTIYFIIPPANRMVDVFGDEKVPLVLFQVLLHNISRIHISNDAYFQNIYFLYSRDTKTLLQKHIKLLTYWTYFIGIV